MKEKQLKSNFLEYGSFRNFLSLWTKFDLEGKKLSFVIGKRSIYQGDTSSGNGRKYHSFKIKFWHEGNFRKLPNSEKFYFIIQNKIYEIWYYK